MEYSTLLQRFYIALRMHQRRHVRLFISTLDELARRLFERSWAQDPRVKSSVERICTASKIPLSTLLQPLRNFLMSSSEGMPHNVFSPEQMAGAFMPFILNPSFVRKPSARAYRQIQPLELRNSERKPLTLPYNQ
jgi:hypothetical protein